MEIQPLNRDVADELMMDESHLDTEGLSREHADMCQQIGWHVDGSGNPVLVSHRAWAFGRQSFGVQVTIFHTVFDGFMFTGNGNVLRKKLDGLIWRISISSFHMDQSQASSRSSRIGLVKINVWMMFRPTSSDVGPLRKPLEFMPLNSQPRARLNSSECWRRRFLIIASLPKTSSCTRRPNKRNGNHGWITIVVK